MGDAIFIFVPNSGADVPSPSPGDARLACQGEMSEADRKQEWKTLSHTECMLERGIAKGLEGSIDAEDHRACSEEPELEDLDRKTAEIGQMRKSHANEAGPITFGGGEGWKVSSNGETAADYS